ncbi:Low temperature viability protein-domain-containing protein [Lyophyllum atratum]|nr:Low temperature viability protein-domain-containing protein [Lyophyllum atratum]
MPPKSIFRQPGAKHFQLVHRSQRDPLIHDPDASKHVLKPVERENAKKGKNRADLESVLPSTEVANDKLANVGEASVYGVYYDDTEYNYMQHLRAVGVQEDGVESVLIEAPSTSKSSKAPARKTQGIELRDLPPDVLASKAELPRTYESQQAVPASISGFQPDMDPHLRQALEALEDDAFVNDDLEDDFFGELVGDGERDSDENLEFDFDENGLEDLEAHEGGVEREDGEDEEGGWEERFAQFKRAQKIKQAQSDDGYDGSEGGDTIGTLPAMSVIGGKKRRKGTSDASGYSMSSSSMYRNEALQTLDERFDQMIVKQYNEDDEDTPLSEEENDSDEDAPELITSRADFESMMDEFLNDYEILGRKMKLKLAGESGVEKLDTIRRALGQDDRVWLGSAEDDDVNDEDIMMPLDLDDKKDRWDCETVLTTYSNLENHPRLIRARDPKPVPKIHLDPKTGLPTVVDPLQKTQPKVKSGRGRVAYEESDDDSGSDTDTPGTSVKSFPCNASYSGQKARKDAVKADRQMRRVEKKAVKEQFGAELKSQKRTVGNKERRLKKL